jgi:hypothetical protein
VSIYSGAGSSNAPFPGYNRTDGPIENTAGLSGGGSTVVPKDNINTGSGGGQSVASAYAGGDSAFSIVPAYTAVQFIIKT